MCVYIIKVMIFHQTDVHIRRAISKITMPIQFIHQFNSICNSYIRIGYRNKKRTPVFPSGSK